MDIRLSYWSGHSVLKNFSFCVDEKYGVINVSELEMMMRSCKVTLIYDINIQPFEYRWNENYPLKQVKRLIRQLLTIDCLMKKLSCGVLFLNLYFKDAFEMPPSMYFWLATLPRCFYVQIITGSCLLDDKKTRSLHLLKIKLTGTVEEKLVAIFDN